MLTQSDTNIAISSDLCKAFVCSFIAREGSWFPCALPFGHEGSHHSGGKCFTHGDYISKEPWRPPACPQCDNTIKFRPTIPVSYDPTLTVSYDPTIVQQRPTAPDTEQDVGRFVINHLISLHMPEVATDHEKRIEMGEKKYGQRLRTNNGRDAFLDAYQEVLDFLSYLMQAILEGHNECQPIFNKAAQLASEMETLLRGNPNL